MVTCWCYSAKNQDRNRGTKFTFRDAKVPWTRPSRRLQDLTGETPAAANDSSQQTAKDHFRITVYYTSIGKVVSELQSSFEGNDQEVLCALSKIVFSYSPSINNIQTISSFYGVDSEMLSSEKSIFENYDCRDPCQGKNAAVMVKTMHQQVSFGQIMFSPPNKIFPVRRCLNLLLLNCCVPPIPPKTVKWLLYKSLMWYFNTYTVFE